MAKKKKVLTYYVLNRKVPAYLKIMSRHATLREARQMAVVVRKELDKKCDECDLRIDCLVNGKCGEVIIGRLIKGRWRKFYGVEARPKR